MILLWFNWQWIKLIFPQFESVLPMMVIAEWSSSSYLDPQAFFFLSLVQLGRWSERVPLVSTWHLPGPTHHTLPSLFFSIWNTLLGTRSGSRQGHISTLLPTSQPQLAGSLGAILGPKADRKCRDDLSTAACIQTTGQWRGTRTSERTWPSKREERVDSISEKT